MPATALAEPLAPISTLRRFALPDIDTHGAFLLTRLKQSYQHLNDRFILGWIRTLLYDNANLFLYQDHSVALFQLTNIYSLAPKPEIIERFVFCKEGFQKEAGAFYAEVAQWAKSLSVEKIWVEEMSDCPHEIIKENIGRIFARQQQFARV
jgi:hypothetical protein